MITVEQRIIFLETRVAFLTRVLFLLLACGPLLLLLGTADAQQGVVRAREFILAAPTGRICARLGFSDAECTSPVLVLLSTEGDAAITLQGGSVASRRLEVHSVAPSEGATVTPRHLVIEDHENDSVRMSTGAEDGQGAGVILGKRTLTDSLIGLYSNAEGVYLAGYGPWDFDLNSRPRTTMHRGEFKLSLTPSGESALEMFGTNGHLATQLAVGAGGTRSLKYWEPSGTLRTVLGSCDLLAKKTGDRVQTSPGSLTLFGKDGTTVVQLPQ